MIPYGINFPIIVSWRTYKKGGSEIQHKHLSRKLPDLIDAYGFSYVLLNKDSSEYAVSQIMDCELKNQICVLEEDSFSEVALGKEYALDLSPYPKRSGFLKILNNFFMGTDVVFIGTTGNTSREMYYFMPDCNNFYMAGNMGGALSVGLGISKSNRKVVVCGGDAEFAMHMGGMVTAGRYSKEVDLTYILFDNESNKSTGGQGTYQDHINYTNIAKNSNFSPLSGSMGVINLSKFKEAILLGKSIGKGVKFIHVKCSYDSNVSRPSADEISKYPISNLEAE
jgi:phosphonopyruvate decarboxylase